MNKTTLLFGVAVGVGSLGVQQAMGLELDWTKIGDAKMVFKSAVGATAANFTFQHSTTTGSGFDFSIYNSSNTGAGTAIGDLGLFTGTFNITGLVENPLNTGANGLHVETATVTASVGAQVIIVDGGYNAGLGLNAPANANHEFKGTVTFDTIVLLYNKSGSSLTYVADGISSSIPNITGGTYTGTQADLLALATGPSNITGGWTFNGQSLKTMTTSGSGLLNPVNSSGGIITTVPDGGMTLVMLGLGLSGLMLVKRELV